VFSPYGSAALTDSGGGSIATSAIGNTLMRQGMPRDAETRRDDNRHRAYTHEAGRWAQRDPLFMHPLIRVARRDYGRFAYSLAPPGSGSANLNFTPVITCPVQDHSDIGIRYPGPRVIHLDPLLGLISRSWQPGIVESELIQSIAPRDLNASLGARNLLIFGNDNPVRFMDPTGLYCGAWGAAGAPLWTLDFFTTTISTGNGLECWWRSCRNWTRTCSTSVAFLCWGTTIRTWSEFRVTCLTTTTRTIVEGTGAADCWASGIPETPPPSPPAP
jgi:hypothetical protein